MTITQAPAAAASGHSVEDQFLHAALAGENCFLTGMAGTGKSHTLRRFIDLQTNVAVRIVGDSAPEIAITAPTGVAAINIGGITLHRFCGIGLGPQEGQNWEDFWAAELAQKMKSDWKEGPGRRIRNTKTIVIDEISMLPGQLLDFVDWLFRRVRGRESVPFGGMQVIGVGDFLQLPPVRTGNEQGYDWAFKSAAWEAAQFRCFNLTTCRRQDEPDFVRALSDFRIGRCSGETARLLSSRVQAFMPSRIPRLCTHNVQVDKWNRAMLEELDGEPFSIGSASTGEARQQQALWKIIPVPLVIDLKSGATVMCVVNRGDSYYNGMLGTVLRRIDDSVLVRANIRGQLRDIMIDPFTWRLDPKDPNSATVTQIPLRLAYAMTIHKSQGVTLDAAHMDIRAAREPGQAYVAVSRVRTLNGLSFKEWPKGIHVSNEAIAFYRKMNQ